MTVSPALPPRPVGARFSLVLLVASLVLVAITSALSIATAWRTRANTRQLLRDYAAFAAWSYRERLTDVRDAPFDRGLDAGSGSRSGHLPGRRVSPSPR